MAELKCEACGTDLRANPGELVKENREGFEVRRCPKCFAPYQIPAKKGTKELKPEPVVEPVVESEPPPPGD